MDDNKWKPFYEDGVGTNTLRTRYRTDYLYIWKFPKTDPQPPKSTIL